MEDVNFRKGDAKTEVFGSNRMLQPSPVEKIPDGPTTPEIAYQMVKDETFAQTQPRLNLATFVTTYMDDYATKLMNEAININYIDETEYPRIAVMNGKCINIVANLWNSPEKDTWKTGALAIGSSEACMLGGVAAWLRWRKKRQAQGKPFDKPNFVISTGFQVVWEKFAQLWQIEMREVPLTLDKTTLDPEEALKMCDENTICIVPIQGVTWTGLNDDVEALDKALDAYNAKTGYDIPIHVDAASGGFILPFLYPETKWDFRLKWVLSISVSGHKFGLVYPGLGWVCWKGKEYLPEEMSFSVNYLGANITQVGLNFSRPAAQILGQYYQFTLPAEKRVYIATMQVYDEESVQRVARHRAQRADKGFTTIECEKDLASADVPEGSVVLLEDLVNLMANEMFGGGDTSRILPALNALARKCQHLILVTNDVFSDGIHYPDSTREYLRQLAKINAEAAKMADCVVEVVYSIPVCVKGALPCM